MTLTQIPNSQRINDWTNQYKYIRFHFYFYGDDFKYKHVSKNSKLVQWHRIEIALKFVSAKWWRKMVTLKILKQWIECTKFGGFFVTPELDLGHRKLI